jgi:hypothetical protein
MTAPCMHDDWNATSAWIKVGTADPPYSKSEADVTSFNCCSCSLHAGLAHLHPVTDAMPGPAVSRRWQQMAKFSANADLVVRILTYFTRGLWPCGTTLITNNKWHAQQHTADKTSVSNHGLHGCMTAAVAHVCTCMNWLSQFPSYQNMQHACSSSRPIYCTDMQKTIRCESNTCSLHPSLGPIDHYSLQCISSRHTHAHTHTYKHTHTRGARTLIRRYRLLTYFTVTRVTCYIPLSRRLIAHKRLVCAQRKKALSPLHVAACRSLGQNVGDGSNVHLNIRRLNT